MFFDRVDELQYQHNDGKMVGITTDKDMLKAAARKTSIPTAYLPKELMLKTRQRN